MKKSLFLLLILLPFSLLGETTEKEFTFHYINHDRSTNVQKLSKTIQKAFDDAVEYDNICIFYLANGEEPYIVQVNTANDNRQDFALLIGEIQEKLSHDIAADFDIEKIMNILEEAPILNEDKELLYSSVNWNYYISPTFWDMQYHQSIIAPLYWNMNMDWMKENLEFYLNVLVADGDIIEYDKEQPFGVKNVSNINNGFVIQAY